VSPFGTVGAHATGMQRTLQRLSSFSLFVALGLSGSEALALDYVQDCGTLSGSPFSFANIPSNAVMDYSPALNAWYAVWVELAGVSQVGQAPAKLIKGRMLTPGTPFTLGPIETIFTTPTMLGGATPFVYQPMVAATDHGFFIAYAPTLNTNDASLAFRFRTAAALGPETSIDRGGVFATVPNVAYNASNQVVLVTWIGSSGGSATVFGNAFDISAALPPAPRGGSSPKTIATGTTLTRPAPAPRGGGFGVAWLNAGFSNVNLTKTGFDGLPVGGAVFITGGAGSFGSLRLSGNGTDDFVFAWTTSNQVQGTCARVGATRLDTTPVKVFSSGGVVAQWPSFARFAGGTHVAWSYRNPAGATANVRVAQLDLNFFGSAFNCDPFAVTDVAVDARDEITPHLSSGQTGLVASWSAAYSCATTGQDIYAKPVGNPTHQRIVQ
jgi:hypothetical protein